MRFKPHVISQNQPPELKETININSWKDMIYMAYKIMTRYCGVSPVEVSKERIKIDPDPFPHDNSFIFIYPVSLDGFGLIGFADEANINETGIESI